MIVSKANELTANLKKVTNINGTNFIDYYKVLGVDRSVDVSGIKKAYRKLALKYYPEKNVNEDTRDVFAKIAEAYDVLTSAETRAIFDQYSHQGLFHGVPARENEFPGYLGYKFHGDPYVVFEEFFGGKNPFEDFFSVHTESGHSTTKFGSKFGGLYGMNNVNPLNEGVSEEEKETLQRVKIYGKKKDDSITHELKVTLEELYFGVVKKMKVTKKELNDDNITTSTIEKILTIEIQPGVRENTLITFKNEGDQGPNVIPGDIIFKIVQTPHEYFTRKGDDIIYKKKIGLVEALTGSIQKIVCMDGRILNIPVNEVVSEGYEKVVIGEGMPILGAEGKKGNLVISFSVEFPRSLTQEQKRLVRRALS
ncbi:hypothetical protein HK098_007553 [Nowakowskiella sp. JEL0407]|nr:hypothetical protein HK098_007553 [Nowakowskiella sp. JEL0407]